MTECSIDKESLPTVTEVRRGFAVLEDRSLAHNLQEQEIEHHLASNVQRNRLVQHDLQVAKRLQEEEDHKAQLRLQKRQREIERRDNQMAQVIQDELALQAEQRRQQEETDEAIARKLQEKEERRRKKHHQDNTSQDPYHMESFDESKVGLRLESGVKEVTQGICQLSASEWEQRDAELARKLQEEEMLATQEAQKEAQKAAQMAQDEEIARLLMEKEKRAYRKHKGESGRAAEDEGRKRSSERKPHEHDKKYEAGDYTRPKMCDGPEAGLGKPERPVRPPGPKKDSDDFDLNYKSSPQRPPRPSSRSTESSQKASYYRQ
uniref:Coiled-coil domain-containing protein 50-like protein n=1 Tax=Callorhinchus milii TaxID=7868 RepID=V9KQL2_CALMI